MSLSLTAVRFYTANDPYIQSVDNRPLEDLEARDAQLLAELNKKTYAVDITGSATPTVNAVPVGWTVAQNGTGDYTITHNLGTAAYIAIPTVVDSTGGFAHIHTITSTTVRLMTRNTTGTATHKRFALILSVY